MKKFINRDIVIGLILVIANFCFLCFDVDFLLTGLLYFSLLIFVFVEFISIFTLWHKYKYSSFIPFTISLVFLPLMILFGSIGNKIGMYYTPSCPTKYFKEERKKELTGIAEELLGTQDEKSKQVIEEKLKRYRLAVHNIDHYSNIVEFGYYRSRIASIYIFAKDGLPEKYSTKPVITEEDIRSWAELSNIIKTENNPSKYSRDNIVVEPEIVYPFLMKYLDKAFVDKLAGLESYHDYAKKYETDSIPDGAGRKWGRYHNFIANKISDEEKAKIVEILNEQCRITSGLVEDSNISWRSADLTLELGKYSELFDWPVDRHLRHLISDGVISVKDREGHLQVKPNLSDKETLEIEWLQVEIMRHIYGNLFRKIEYWSNGKTKLADNWYFYQD
jgi:hypothetical protein